MRSKIAVIGSSNIDFVMRLQKLPAPGETVTEGEFLQAYGGKGANQAVAAARAGGEVTFVTCVGDDLFAAPMIENFRRDGIETSRIVRQKSTPTGSALIMVDRHGENYISVAPGANHGLLPHHIESCANLIAASDFVVLQMEISVATTRCALELASRHGTRVLFNFAPMHTRELPVSSAMTGLIVNEGEAEALTSLPVRGPDTAKRAAEVLRQQGPSFVVVTLGSAGALVSSAEDSAHIPGFTICPVDATAAGDTFCGALAVALGEKMKLPAAVRFASGAAALSVTRMGAQPSIPSREEIEKFLAQEGPPCLGKGEDPVPS